ncbi:hypothetical protein E2C01_055743 [Portunus trituberculatus]|uniref:Uncharacterized protein n=1 Tax=Portunus trituberculatus TaxID=210409 RepID=A0A5B7GXS4_PORTR|nr:hypothetical protein [Portunus trituberculatus]
MEVRRLCFRCCLLAASPRGPPAITLPRAAYWVKYFFSNISHRRVTPVPVLYGDHTPGRDSSYPQAGASFPNPQFVNILPNI